MLRALRPVALAALLGAAPPIGGAAPPFDITLADGGHVTAADLRGKVVVINFWATWCVPCREELPLLDAYYRQHRAAGLRIFAVSAEVSPSAAKTARLFAGLAIPAARRLTGRYDIIAGLPTTYVIDRTGRLRYAAGGAFTAATLRTTLAPLLREAAP